MDPRDMEQIYVFDRGGTIEHGRYHVLMAENGRFAQIIGTAAGLELVP